MLGTGTGHWSDLGVGSISDCNRVLGGPGYLYLAQELHVAPMVDAWALKDFSYHILVRNLLIVNMLLGGPGYLCNCL